MTGAVWHIVIVDDSPDDRAEVRRLLLKGSDRRFTFAEAETGAAGLHALREGVTAQHRCVVLDYNLPDMAASAFLAAMSEKEGAPDWPVVVFTGGDSAEIGRNALRAGAHDYIGKGWMTQQGLVRAVENASERWAMARELREQTAAAQTSERHFLALAQATSDIVYRMSADWSEVLALDGPARNAGPETPREGWAWLNQHIPADEHARVKEAIGQAIAQKALFSLEHRVLRPDGSIAWTASRAVPICDANGSVLEWFGAAADITQRKTAEDALRASEERFRLAAEAVDGVIYDEDLATHRVVRTEGLFRVLGYKPDEVPATLDWWEGQIHPDDIAAGSPQGVAASGTHAVCGYRVKHKDGRWLHLEDRSVLVRNASGEPARTVGCTTDVSARFAAEAALRQSQDFLRRVTAITPGVLRVFDLAARRWVFSSRSVSSLLGFSAEQIAASGTDTAPSIMHPDDVRRFEQHLDRVCTLADGDVAEFEHRMRDAAGEWRWFLSSDAVFERDEAGRVRQIIGVASDITARKGAELALERSQQQFRTLADSIPQLCFIADPDGRTLWYNDRWYTYTGTTFEEMEGTGWHRVHDPRVLTDVMARWQHAISRKEPFEMIFPIKGANKRYRQFLTRILPVMDELGAVARWFGTSTDITAVKDIEAALSERERELQTLADNTPDILARFDRQARHLFINASIERVTGLAPGAFLGKTNRELGLPIELCDMSDAALAIAFDEGRTLSREFGVDTAAGVLHFHATLVPERGHTGEVVSVLCVIRDRTEEQQAQDALRFADLRKDEFIATLAHELRNPLAPLRTGLQVLKLSRDPAIAQRTQLIMERQLKQMVRLIDDLLDVSRITTGKVVLRPERIVLQAMIQTAIDAVQPLLDASSQILQLDVPSEPIWLQADPTRISQAVTNLLTNAAKYSRNGSVTALSVQRAEGAAVITVADSGEGIPPNMLSDIFDMFTQVDRTLDRAQGGLGIGLALVKRLVEMHGGTVSATSAGLGTGSTFTLRLPMSGDPAAVFVETPAPPVSAASDTRLRVLIVDDNVDAAETLAALLSLHGHETRVAGSGATAVAIAREFMPEVAFLDIGMPGMNGNETARHLRAEDRSGCMSLVALTGWGADSDRARAKEAGFDLHFTKPIDLDDVVKVLQQVATSQSVGRADQT